MDCQLEDAGAAVDQLSLTDRARRQLERGVGRLGRAVSMLVHDRSALQKRLHVIQSPGSSAVAPPGEHDQRLVRRRGAVLGLAPGEQVRVKSREAITGSLDADGRCDGLAYVPGMDAFCGKTFLVRKRVERFFDERTRTMLSVRDVVLLDGVFCEIPANGAEDYAGCHRSCFLFWKEAWLERAT